MSTDRPRRVNIVDVARHAGVSHQTVSRVINDSPLVAAPTRAKVRAAIEELGFRPNRLARALAGGAAREVTVLTTDTSLYGASETLSGIEDAARAAGFTVSVSVMNPVRTGGDADALARIPHLGSPAIVIAHDATTTRAMRALRATQPATTVATGGGDLADETETADWLVALDDRAVAARATRHLLDLGHRTVHYLSIPSKAPRQLGWEQALQATGRAAPVPAACDWSIASAYHAASDLLEDPEVTAILCGNDDLAVGVIRAAHDAGRRVPYDLSVVGFDDCPFAAFQVPALTTVGLDFRGLGRGAFDLLRSKLDGEAPPRPSWRQPELIVRETSAPPRSR
ncbi:LacI family DNA-binding transcriptional regulator [Glycomyces paridis]|uniref:LacI family transcriptional regulator n=1 Tax=Glycomyces paridis TaxID=2126555 RepID=A0A4S8PJC3_9ACTN|nr:substrate-binding domain-containing protein [Glycomyces paridis]THV29582.1 LacI family transcriptional regulator [Glycomyces paridis]